MRRAMQWSDAIQLVLKEHNEPMRYEAIAQEILDRGLREPTPTPAATVAATLSMSLQREGMNSPFVRVRRGVYALRATSGFPVGPQVHSEAVLAGDPVVGLDETTDDAAADAESMGLINAFGMFWRRDEVHWDRTTTRLLGIQQAGGIPVDFSAQAGVYLLYDANRIVYVGRVTGPRLGSRMWEHTRDRLTGRWDRFSWFGVRGVANDGGLGPLPGANIAVDSLISTMEALLIEGLEPPQNRRQGDGFNAVEFLQHPDPEVSRQQSLDLLNSMQDRLRS
jgi:HB1, ASXL, restriction endonuclease HTH domain